MAMALHVAAAENADEDAVYGEELFACMAGASFSGRVRFDAF